MILTVSENGPWTDLKYTLIPSPNCLMNIFRTFWHRSWRRARRAAACTSAGSTSWWGRTASTRSTCTATRCPSSSTSTTTRSPSLRSEPLTTTASRSPCCSSRRPNNTRNTSSATMVTAMLDFNRQNVNRGSTLATLPSIVCVLSKVERVVICFPPEDHLISFGDWGWMKKKHCGLCYVT